MDFYTVFTYSTIPFMLLALMCAWKYEGARYFLTLLLGLEIVDVAMYKVSFNWTTHLYLYNMFMCALFLVPIIYRHRIAYNLYKLTRQLFFLRVYRNHHFAVQEIGMMSIFAIDFVLNLFIYIEVWLYKFYVIDDWLMSAAVRNYIVISLQILMYCALLTYVFRTPQREAFYGNETN
ncbi:hypothetical protein CWB99_08520 [Pseudoalteromonas rubra]|uniref:Uncharacterized protein n=2 Tax=Pseudoalteromonas rubra TaxID=43658 RepID=A0A5S3WNN3_9GAMM|nr:hypothetical protein CWB99_08520 [Pseudoalteromonas rubra]TMP35228.1 hypothetical protein CWC00_05485 [Pseudoalteromonas rubra]